MMLHKNDAKLNNTKLKIVASTKDSRFCGGLARPVIVEAGVFFEGYDSSNRQSLFQEKNTEIKEIIQAGIGVLKGYASITDYVLFENTSISLSVQRSSGDGAIFTSLKEGKDFQLTVQSGMYIPSENNETNTFGTLGSPRTSETSHMVFGGLNCTNQECEKKSKLSGLYLTRASTDSDLPTIIMTVVSSNVKNPSYPSSGMREFDMFGGAAVRNSLVSFFGTSSSSNEASSNGYLELTPNGRVDHSSANIIDGKNDVASPGIFIVRLDDSLRHIEIVADSSTPWISPSNQNDHHMIAFSDPIIGQNGEGENDYEIVFVAQSNQGVYGIFSYLTSTKSLHLVADTNNTEYFEFPFLPSLVSGRLMFQAVTKNQEPALFVRGTDTTIKQIISLSDLHVSNDTTPFVYMLFTKGGHDGCGNAVLYASSQQADYILQLSSLLSPFHSSSLCL